METYKSYSKEYGVIVVGGGHAGCEAALAAARIGVDTLLLTMNIDTVAHMACNPAIGGLAKGQLVREIDALGGEMGICIDSSGIQFRVLNTKKGPAVQSYRAQADRHLYRHKMLQTLEKTANLDIKQGIVQDIHLTGGKATGVCVDHGLLYKGKTIIIAAGTFLKGLIHIGSNTFPAGRAGEFPSNALSNSFASIGFSLGRLKTGTPPRLHMNSINLEGLATQGGDEDPRPFSFETEKLQQLQVPCYITHTNKETHKIITDNLSRSPLYSGAIKGTGPRYCPSIEDKVKRFPERESHHIFIEPEGYTSTECYPNGISTSLPVDVQLQFLRTIKGFEEVEIMRPGYAIEYDFVFPTQLKPTLETKQVQNLFHAGQINGTSGYEEAAAQGLMAGINAAMSVLEKDPLVLGREEAYIGVLIDDLVTKGTEEPYRMFTSRAEYRLLLRTDNADMRLSEKGYQIGLLKKEIYKRYLNKKNNVETEILRLKKTTLPELNTFNAYLQESGRKPVSPSHAMANILKRPEIVYRDLPTCPFPDLNREEMEQVEIQIKYEGYINRQLLEVERFKKIEQKKIPDNFDYTIVSGLSCEIVEKLTLIRPVTVGQASRISGVTPSAITMLIVNLEKNR